MLYLLVLTLHNLNRWLVLLCGLWATWQVLRAWIGNQPWSPRTATVLRGFIALLDLQLLLGLVLYLLPGGLIQAVLHTIPWPQLIKDRLLRFFALEHPLQMLIAIALAHAALVTARRAKNERRRLAWTALLLTLAMVLILSAIPWPVFYYGRPWLRLAW
ncbi:MAG TPA: hypothetical protein PKE45_22610 [Caldilineaceae bacterium]|nr:hypothetical protein [Caldilineaceae bacterium]